MDWRSMVCEGKQPVPVGKHRLREGRSTSCKDLQATKDRQGVFVIGDAAMYERSRRPGHGAVDTMARSFSSCTKGSAYRVAQNQVIEKQ
jgi:hypothetical protein